MRKLLAQGPRLIHWVVRCDDIQSAGAHAGYAAGVCPDLPGFAARWRCERRFEPQMDATMRERKWAGWRDAVARTLS